MNANYSQLICRRRAGRTPYNPAIIPHTTLYMDSLLAAVDLGSNSFRLSIGRVVQQDGMAHLYTVDRLRESVQLANGLDENNRLSDEAIDRAITILKRFGERLAGFSPARVRAVATNTFRVATNIDELLPLAQQALGFPIAVISGREEARLIYLGVANELPPAEENRLVVDIGGGSTELIIGKGFEPLRLSSVFVGCVSHTRRFFPDARITSDNMRQAIVAAQRELEAIASPYRKTGWRQAYGSSGTAKGLQAILAENGWSDQGITLAGMQQLRAKLIHDGKADVRAIPGLRPERAPVLAGGLAIMLAVFQELKITCMLPGDGALRAGVLYDMLGRVAHHDKRDETVRQFIRRYQIDAAQAARVKTLAQTFFHQLALDDGQRQDLQLALGWAASLHEIGLSVAHADYHKHGAYILEHADMPGFTREDQALLALLVLGHQGKLSKLKRFKPGRYLWLTLLCLRLAVQLLRRRGVGSERPLRLQVTKNIVTIHVPKTWLHAHPLSEYTLQNEAREWKKVGFTLEIETT